MDRSLYYAARSIVSQGGKGRREGEAKGRSEGLAEGRAEERITMAYNMKAKGFSPELIAEITGLSPEEIASL